MKERIKVALFQAATEGKNVVQLQVLSREAIMVITSSAEFFRGCFLGVPVVLLSRDASSLDQDFILICAN